MRVRKGAKYIFHAVGHDAWSPVHTGIQEGETVTVVHPFGCPPPNTMGHCHVNRADGTFGGLVQTSSLQPRRK